tara:strand:- start:575 stop:1324 length:750 start_codon:yes stop_codon:yes gene_type:complete
MTKLAAEQIKMAAFHDELEKLGAAPAILAGLARLLPAIGRIGARAAAGVGKRFASGAQYAKSMRPTKILKKAPKTTIKRPGIFQRMGGQATRNTRLLFTNPAKLMREQYKGMRTFTTSAKSSKIRGGKYYGRFGKPKKVLGYNRAGQAIVQRSPLGTATIGLGFSGAGMGGLEFATNKYDEQGRKRSLGQRLGRAGREGAIWTVAPTAAMGYYGLKFVHDIAKSSKQTKPQTLSQANLNYNNQLPMGMS